MSNGVCSVPGCNEQELYKGASYCVRHIKSGNHRSNTNLVSRVLFWFGILEIICGVIVAVVLARRGDIFETAIGIQSLGWTLIVGFLFIGLSEIIKLLQKGLEQKS